MAIDRFIDAPAPLPLEGPELIQVGRTHLRGDLSREADGIAFTGDIETAVTLTCSRCLEPHSVPLDLHFNLLYTTGPEEVGKKESRLDENSVTRTRFDGTRIDLAALLSEQIYLELPLKPLCRADCRGLCAQCGANLNQGTCGCEEKAIDHPPLRSLKRVF